MSKIVNAMPDDPRTFMCRILQRKSDYTVHFSNMINLLYNLLNYSN